MKRELYNLTDEEFAYFVSNLHKQMEAEKLPYVLVGGAAVQAHVLDRMCRKTGKNISQLVSAPDVRLHDYFRSTDDIDLAVDSSVATRHGDIEFAKIISRVLDKLQVREGSERLSPSEEHFLAYVLQRGGMKRSVFQVYVDGETDGDSMITINVGRSPRDLENLDSKFYDVFVREGQVIEISYCPGFTLTSRVIKPEHLLASKISKFRIKDTMDMHSLADIIAECGETVDVGEIKRLLLPRYEINYHRFLSLANLEDPNHH